MGKGDQRSRRGKIHRGTFGKRRPKPKTKKAGAPSDGSAESSAPTRGKTKEARIVKKQASE